MSQKIKETNKGNLYYSTYDKYQYSIQYTHSYDEMGFIYLTERDFRSLK